MPNPVVHFEIMGKNQDRLKTFYSSLFGWETADHSMPDGVYVGVNAKAGGIGGGIGVMPGPAPAMATCYVEVPDPQATLDKVTAGGGKVMLPVTDMGMVVIAMFADPEGYPVGLVKSDPTQGAHEHEHVDAAEGAVEWFEVVGTDGTKLQNFYKGVFDWEMHVHDETYAMVDTKAGGIGMGIGQAPAGQGHQIFYIHTADIPGKLKQIETAGGKTLLPETDMGMVVFAMFSDPDGAVVGLVHEGKQQH